MSKMNLWVIMLFLTVAVPGALRAQDAAVESEGLPEVRTYDELRHAISQARAASRGRVETAVERERVREAWEIGRLIDKHVLQHKERADYADHVLTRLSGDLGMSERELYYSLRFYRGYPILPHASKLSWSEYRDLLSVDDPQERQALAAQAEKENWDRARLRKEVRNVTKGGKAVPEEVLTAEPGKPETYRVILAKAGPYSGKLAIDLGFSNYVSLSSVTASPGKFKEGDILSASQDPKGGYKLSAIGSGPESLLYTYNAYIYEVLDGDTVNAVVDLGFDFVTTQTLRLRGINAPEIETADGMESKEALEKMINAANSKEGDTGQGPRDTGKARDTGEGSVRGSWSVERGTRILIRTVKSDKYDRYLADVFIDRRPRTADSSQSEVSSPQSDFIYVNQELLDEGLAVRVEE